MRARYCSSIPDFATETVRVLPFAMSVSTVLVLAVTLYALLGSAQELSNPLILNDVCLPEDDLASRAADQDISDALRNIAYRLVNGSSEYVQYPVSGLQLWYY